MKPSTEQVVRQFMQVVRSGREPRRAAEFMAPCVLAHQIRAEPSTIERDPDDYAAHVEQMIDEFGHFELRVDELLVDGAKAYVRWTQFGRHQGVIDGVAPTGRELTTIGSAVYRVEDGKIVEYWIQLDPAGLAVQLARQLY